MIPPKTTSRAARRPWSDEWLAMWIAAATMFSGCGRVHFAKPWAFLLLFCVAALAFVRFRRTPATLDYSRGQPLDGSPTSLRIRLRELPTVLYITALVFVVIALARPQIREFRDAQVDGIDIMVALDLSGSMSAVDMSLTEIQSYQRRHNLNPPNRFDHAKKTLKHFVDGRSRDRIGMVVFAKHAYLQFPLTLDYATIQGLLDQLELADIDPSGTAIGNALGLSIRGLLESDASSRTIILITDGKNQGGNVSPLHAAEIARDETIRIFPILVGGGGETLVPVGGLSRQVSRFRPENHPVDPDLLQQIADMTGGEFYHAARPESLERDLNKILDQLDRSRITDVANVRAHERYMPFALWGFLLILIGSALDAYWLRRLL